jgi:hypothetical protein
LDREVLKEAIAKFLVSQNLSFQTVESESFIELLDLCNPVAANLLVKADALIDFVMKKYLESKELIKELFVRELFISLTCDVWTSPNCKSILGITAHWIDRNFQLHEILLDALELNGSHTGANMAQYVLKTLEEYGLKEKLFCVTADNASNNKTMAKVIEQHIASFKADCNLLGCTGHVFNLAARVGLKALGYEPQDHIVSEEERETEVNLNSDWGEDGEMDCDASDEEFNPSSIMDRVRGLCKYVRSSPQRRSQFEECVRASYQQSAFRPVQPQVPAAEPPERIEPSQPSTSN